MNNPSLLQIGLARSGMWKAAYVAKKTKGGYKGPDLHTCPSSDIPHPPQRTDMYQDRHGNRMHTARDMGFGHPFWARTKAEAIIDAADRLDMPSWATFKVPHRNEPGFMKLVNEVLGEKGAELDGLVVRAVSPGKGICSWFFMAGMDVGVVKRGLEELSGESLGILDKAQLRETLRGLFDHSLHPKVRDLDRWSALKPTMHKLRVSRVAKLIEMVRNGEEYELCEGLSDTIDFATRLAAYLYAENAVLERCSLDEKRDFVKETGMVDGDELVDVAKQLLQILEGFEDWGWCISYRGMPRRGAAADRKSGCYEVTEYRLWAVSRRIDGISEEELMWETIEYPEGDDECPWSLGQKPKRERG